MNADRDSIGELTALAHRWIRVGWQRPAEVEFMALHADDFIDRSSAGRAADRHGFWFSVKELFAAFPDFHADADDILVEPHRQIVTVRWHASGTHGGPFLGISPAGKLIHFSGIKIIRVRQEQVVEHWGEWNGLEILEQLR